MTDAEWRMWYFLRAQRFQHRKFRRQVPIGPYVADFLCEKSRLIVEIDGGQHADRRDADVDRTRWLELQGYRVLRFWNNDVFENIEGVLQMVATALDPLPGPPPRGRET